MKNTTSSINHKTKIDWTEIVIVLGLWFTWLVILWGVQDIFFPTLIVSDWKLLILSWMISLPFSLICLILKDIFEQVMLILKASKNKEE